MPILNRANSSPNLRDTWHSKLDTRLSNIQLDDNELENEYDGDFYVIGDRVYVDGHRSSSVAYFGETEFGSGDWVGVVLDEPTGNHNGKLHGREYFQCAPYHGLFVRTHRVSRISDSALGSSATSSRATTPLLSFQHQQRRQLDSAKRRMDNNSSYNGYDSSNLGSQRQTRPSSRMSNGSSLLDSYYYDEDYRQDRVPTVASLARKLKQMDDRQQQQHQRQRPMSRATSSSSSTSPVGILKHYSSQSNSNSNDNSSRSNFISNDHDEHLPLSPPSNFGSRVDDLNRRLRASSASPSASPRSVFNFRPKREQLNTTAVANNGQAMINDYGKGKRSVYLSSVDPPQKGDRVLIRTEREGELSGILRFMGETNFATGEWAGIELDDPVGKNDGSILGCRYFYCPKNYGLFVPATRVRKYNDKQADNNKHERLSSSQSYGSHHYSSSNPSIFSSMRSTIKSPPPPLTSLSRYSSGSRSTTPNYEMSPVSTSSPSQQSTNNTAARRQTANYFPEYSGSSYLTSLSPSSLDSRKNNDIDWSERISPMVPKRESSLNRQSLFSDTNGYNNLKSSASSSSLFNNNSSSRRPKFDDRDIEIQLNKSLNTGTRPRVTTASSSIDLSSPKPKAVKYTFISNKLDGNPIVRRTLIYK